MLPRLAPRLVEEVAFVTLFDEELGEERVVLAVDSGDEGSTGSHRRSLPR